MKYYHMEISQSGRYAFVPAEYGRYIRTHVCVLFVDCTNPLCNAKKNSPCISLPKLAKFETRVPQVKVCKERMAAYRGYQAAQPKVDDSGKVIKIRKGGRKRG